MKYCLFFYSMRKPNLDSIPVSSGQTDTETPAGINRPMRPRKRAEEAHEVLGKDAECLFGSDSRRAYYLFLDAQIT
ncbi:hypothetical protein BALCAV_0222640 [Alkalihalobacillus alcalophilus ATCC 27647 = CGMCC 1.3604]|uniref:Uncharacterized protein n=1 Tax=Alkalihalobacillus alcalophilus ATCC 27647 = CGMCC 1.3604 TaxID=1218173 RepID=A0A094X9K4_ALKAL|nr:hypothetical protein BALCAV_0222640 [Alkalihalobacillus alcalophilus ATCC 27647 = CGMCC 1.3604]